MLDESLRLSDLSLGTTPTCSDGPARYWVTKSVSTVECYHKGPIPLAETTQYQVKPS